MTDIVLVIQKSPSQSQIWERILVSQGLVPIIESPDVDLAQLLQQASQDNQILPKLIILEMSIDTLNPYEFCRLVQSHYPSLRVILTAQERIQVSEIEQRWANNQGACQLLPGFDYSHLPLSLTHAVGSIMEALGKTDWEKESLVPIVEELTAEFGNSGEKATLIQKSEDFVNEPTPTSASVATVEKTSPNKRRNFKVKPKVKRFRGLPY